jgi:hypothetical protein
VVVRRGGEGVEFFGPVLLNGHLGHSTLGPSTSLRVWNGEGTGKSRSEREGTQRETQSQPLFTKDRAPGEISQIFAVPALLHCAACLSNLRL